MEVIKKYFVRADGTKFGTPPPNVKVENYNPFFLRFTTNNYGFSSSELCEAFYDDGTVVVIKTLRLEDAMNYVYSGDWKMLVEVPSSKEESKRIVRREFITAKGPFYGVRSGKSSRKYSIVFDIDADAPYQDAANAKGYFKYDDGEFIPQTLTSLSFALTQVKNGYWKEITTDKAPDASDDSIQSSADKIYYLNKFLGMADDILTLTEMLDGAFDLISEMNKDIEALRKKVNALETKAVVHRDKNSRVLPYPLEGILKQYNVHVDGTEPRMPATGDLVYGADGSIWYNSGYKWYGPRWILKDNK